MFEKFFVGPDEEDPNANYTGWDLPEHPGLRAWVESLPPLSVEVFYQVMVWTSDREKSTYNLVTPINEEQALEEFDSMYLAAHNGAYGEDVISMSLWSPESNFKRTKLASYSINRTPAA